MSITTASEIPRFPSNLSVPCPYCGVEPGEPCGTRNGRALDQTHQLRRRDVRAAMRSSEFYVELREDDERFGLSMGDVLVATSYWLDPGKVTILRRLSDGFDPECNQYWPSVKFLSFL